MTSISSPRVMVCCLSACIVILAVGATRRAADAQPGPRQDFLQTAQRSSPGTAYDAAISASSATMLEEGRQTVRFASLGSEAFW